MKKVVLFVRVSTQKQEVESQIEALKRNAIVDGFGNDDIIVIAKKESGVKLKEAEREGLNELKAVIAENDIDCVYIYELSRLSRDPMTLYSIRDKIFRENKIQLKCAKPSFSLLEEPDRTKLDTMSSLVFSVFGCFAEQEAVEKKERFHRGKSQNALEGKYNGGTIPYGYDVDPYRDNKFTINHEEAANIHTIFDLYEAGYSLSRIVQEMQERGLKSRSYKSNKKGGTKDFNLRFVHQLLTAELLTGRKVKGASTQFKHYYPPIISEAQFDRCRAIAQEHSTVHGKIPNKYLAKSLLICPECGSPYAAFSAKASYSCRNAIMSEKYRKVRKAQSAKLCSYNLIISINALDSLLWYITIQKECEYLLGSALSDKSHYEGQIEDLREKVEAILPRLNEIEEKRSRIIDSYIDGEISREVKTKKFAELEDQKVIILKQRVDYEQKIEYFQSRIADILSLYSMEGSDSIEIENNIDNLIRIREKIENITSDDEKFRLVHKHIKSVCLENRTISYSHNITPSHQVEVRYLTVTFLDGSIKYYYFIPNDGHGGHWINSDADGNVLNDIDLVIERRYIDKSKIAFREKEKERKKKDFESKYSPDKLFLHSYSEMSEYFGMSRNSIIRRCAEGFFQDALSMYDKRTHILDAERALEIMRACDSSYIKRVVEKFDAKHQQED